MAFQIDRIDLTLSLCHTNPRYLKSLAVTINKYLVFVLFGSGSNTEYIAEWETLQTTIRPQERSDWSLRCLRMRWCPKI